jgi:hypothetical protein
MKNQERSADGNGIKKALTFFPSGAGLRSPQRSESVAAGAVIKENIQESRMDWAPCIQLI